MAGPDQQLHHTQPVNQHISALVLQDNKSQSSVFTAIKDYSRT